MINESSKSFGFTATSSAPSLQSLGKLVSSHSTRGINNKSNRLSLARLRFALSTFYFSCSDALSDAFHALHPFAKPSFCLMQLAR